MKIRVTLISTLLATAIVASIPALSSADWRGDHGVNERQANQRQRIVRNYRNDRLTKREAARLAAQQARIRAFEARNRRDGKGYTARERAATQRRLSEARRDIRHQSRDRQRG